jgi:hypothetical protein
VEIVTDDVHPTYDVRPTHQHGGMFRPNAVSIGRQSRGFSLHALLCLPNGITETICASMMEPAPAHHLFPQTVLSLVSTP